VIRCRSEAAEAAERVVVEELEVGVSPQVMTVGKRSRGVSVSPAGMTTSRVQSGDRKRTS